MLLERVSLPLLVFIDLKLTYIIESSLHDGQYID